MLKTAGASAAAISILGTEAFAKDTVPAAKAATKKKILIIGAHPDDPETGCGGTMMLLAKAGHEVVSVYFTRGERGIPGTGLDASATIRTAEAEKACKIMGVSPIFMSQIDGDTKVNAEAYQEMHELIAKEKPDVVITHWPIDTHRDHVNCSDLVLDAWVKMDKPFDLYYFEVCTGIQTMHFFPTDFVDITSVLKEKHEACFCHVSQEPDDWYDKEHGRMERFRGMQYDCAAAEAFVKFHKSPASGAVLDL